MKCPYCGAEVQANSKCEYCGSFVDASANKKSEERAQEIINKRLLSAHRSIIKMVILRGNSFLTQPQIWIWSRAAFIPDISIIRILIYI